MNFFYFSEIDSTQDWLIEKIKEENFVSPACVASDQQTKGRGSRQNAWDNVENALMFSFAFEATRLPSDLPRQSISIYVGYLLKEWLAGLGCSVWLKWPNDLYRGKSKIGGVLTQKVGKYIVCGIGLNLVSSTYSALDLEWELETKKAKILEFIEFFFKFPTWAYIFQNYKLEFQKNFGFTFHFENKEICFSHTSLCGDGSLLWENQRIYSLR